MSAAPEGAQRARGYSRWKGARDATRFQWWVIAKGNMRLAWGSWLVKGALLLSLVPGFFLAGITYFFLPLSGSSLARTMGGSALFTVIVGALVGARLVAEDRRQGAFLAHFSRPVRGRDYLLGKALALAIPLFFVASSAGLLGIAADAAVPSESFAQRLDRLSGGRAADLPGADAAFLQHVDRVSALVGVVAWALIVSLTTMGMVLGISALSSQARTAGVVWFALVTLGAAAHNILQEAIRDASWPALLSWLDNANDLASMLLGGKGEGIEYDVVTRVAVLAIPAIAGIALVAWRVRRAKEGIA